MLCGVMVSALVASIRSSGCRSRATAAAVARERHPELRILATNAETMTPQSIGETQPFDVILLPNTLNTLQDVQGVLERLEAFCHPRTRLVVSFHNWLWQPMLKAAAFSIGCQSQLWKLTTRRVRG